MCYPANSVVQLSVVPGPETPDPCYCGKLSLTLRDRLYAGKIVVFSGFATAFFLLLAVDFSIRKNWRRRRMLEPKTWRKKMVNTQDRKPRSMKTIR
jgi:hypothetical protein